MSPVPFTLLFAVPGLLAASALIGGGATVAVPVFVFLLVPILDRVLGDNAFDPDPNALLNPIPFVLLLVLYAAIQLSLTTVLLFRAGQEGVYSTFELIALAVSTGVLNGAIGITVAHELIHRSSRIERGVGVALLASVLYAHFRIEHVQGHHAHVATPMDPATARYNQSVYAFWFQSVIGSAVSAWRIEARRMKRLGKRVIHPRNRMLWYIVVSLALTAGIGMYSPTALLFFLIQAVVAFSLLEVVNYVEHYGLERSFDGRRYERVNHTHSWDSPRRLTNYLLINLQRHADHHAEPLRRYPLLRTSPVAPQLPAGYAEMVLLALVPPLWFRRINPLLPQHREAP